MLTHVSFLTIWLNSVDDKKDSHRLGPKYDESQMEHCRSRWTHLLPCSEDSVGPIHQSDQCYESVDATDLNQVIPETELLDNSLQKGRAQLSVKAHRHRPSRSHFRDSMSSTEGDDSLERRVCFSLMSPVIMISFLKNQ